MLPFGVLDYIELLAFGVKNLYIHSVFNKFFRPICVLAPVVDLPLLNQGKGYDTLVTGRMLQ